MLTSSDISRILSAYDIGTALGITATGHGFVNETVIVATERGRFVVRRNHRRFAGPAQRYRHELIGTLCAHGFPTAPLIPARDGETLVSLGGRSYEVLAFVDGGDFDAHRPQHVTSAATVLARYHQVVAGIAPPAEVTPPRYAPLRIPSLTEQLYERDVMGELHAVLAWYDGRASRLQQKLGDASYAALPHLVIHGDIHPDNLRFVGDRVSALLDFDQVTWDARVTDLADALVGLATVPVPEEAQTWGVFRGPLDVERAVSLVAAYSNVAPLSPAEIAALPVLVEVLWLRGELGRVISTPEGAPDYHMAVLEQGRRLSAWMERSATTLLDCWQASASRVAALAA